MDKVLKKTISYSETLSDNGATIAMLRGTITTGKAGTYSVACTPMNKDLFEANKADIETEEADFTAMIREEANAETDADATVTSETAPVSASAKTKTTKTAKK